MGRISFRSPLRFSHDALVMPTRRLKKTAVPECLQANKAQRPSIQLSPDISTHEAFPIKASDYTAEWAQR